MSDNILGAILSTQLGSRRKVRLVWKVQNTFKYCKTAYCEASDRLHFALVLLLTIAHNDSDASECVEARFKWIELGSMRQVFHKLAMANTSAVQDVGVPAPKVNFPNGKKLPSSACALIKLV